MKFFTFFFNVNNFCITVTNFSDIKTYNISHKNCEKKFISFLNNSCFLSNMYSQLVSIEFSLKLKKTLNI